MNLKNVDLNLLVVFEAVYSAGNISHAAARLASSQPAVSNALTRLRDIVGDPLFVRGKRGVDPTVKAKQMIAPVREALGLIGRQLSAGPELDLSNYERIFRVMMMDILEPIIFPPVLAEMAAKAPRISIECLPPHPGIADDLRNGTVDLACFTYPMNPTEITAVPLNAAEITVIARKNHPGIRGKFTADTFMSLNHIALTRELRGMGNVEKDLVAHGLTRKIVYMVNRVWSIAPMVERSDLIAILPGSFAREISCNFDIELYPVPFNPSEQHNYLMWHSRHEHDPAHKWLRDAMIAAVANYPAKGVKRALPAPVRQNKSGSRPRRRATA